MDTTDFQQTLLDELEDLYSGEIGESSLPPLRYSTGSALSPIFSEGSGETSPITPIQVDAPIITRKFENTSCKAGERVVLEVEYIGNNVDVAWYRNGTALDASSGRAEVVNDIGYTALIISSADHLGSSGNYSVTLQNAAGSASNAADLTVEGSPPEVVERPEGGNYKIGSEVKLAGKVVGQPTPQVHWEFNSEEIIDTRFKMYQDAGYCCLEFESATAKDSGKYTMVAENELGEARWTVTINVSVDDRPTSASSQRSVDVITHQRLSQDGHVVVTNEEVEVDPSTRPATKKISPPIASPPASAKRETPPEKKKAAPKQLPKQEEKPEEMPKLKPIKTKPVEAAPPAEKIQLKPAGKGVKEQEEPLKFPELKKRASPTSPTSPDFIKFDKVEEEKKARKSTKKPLKLNIPGKEKRTSVNAARLSKPVELLTPLPDAGKPLFVIAPEDAEFTIGEAAEVKCRIAGDPKPEIQWYKGKWGKLSAVGRISIDFNVESGISTLNIKKIQKPDKGTYRCVAKNDKGEAEASFTLNVVEKAQVRESVDRFALKPKKPVVKDDMNEFDTVKMLRDVDPKEYEKYANHFGVKDFRHLLTTYEEVAANVESEEIDEVENLPTPESAISLVPEEEIWQKCIEAVGKEPVDILQDIRDVIAVAQGDAIFEAEIRINVPNVDVKWFKEDTQLEEGEKYHMSHDGESHSLVIKNVTEEDKGEYRIEAGPAKSTANLEVKGESRKPPQKQAKTPVKVSNRQSPVPKTEIKKEIQTAPPKTIVKQEVPPKPKVVEVPKPQSPVQIDEPAREEIPKPKEIKKVESARVPSPEPIIEIKKEKPVERERAKTPERPKTPVERPKTPPPPPRTPTPPPPTPPPGEPISFVKELKSTSAMLGTKFSFSSTTNYADLEATWYLNGEKIPIYKTMAEYYRTDQGQKFPFVAVKSKGNKHSLECDEAIERFAGTYTVEVSNEDGEKAKSEAQLKVLYEPPVFLKNLEDQHVDEGKKINFICRIDDPNQEVVWYFRDSSDRVTYINPRDKASSFNVQEDGKGGHSLSLTAKKFLEGEVTCRMDFGKSTGSQRDLLIATSAKLTVIANAPPPRFDSPLRDLVKNRRDRVEFECSVSDPDAPVVWFKGDRELRPAAEYDFESKGRARKLVIKNATFDDAGRYSCEMGEEKTSASLKVNELELKVIKSLANVECPLDGDAIFDTVLNSKNAEPLWKKDGAPLRESDDVEMLEEQVEGGIRYRLILRKQTVDDSGEITFSALGNQAKQKASLNVKDLPLGFTLNMDDQIVKPGETARFETNVTRRDAVARWTAGGKPVQNSAKFRVTSRGFTRKLTIEDCDGVKDNYEVVCTVEEAGETASTKANLKTTAPGFAKGIEAETHAEENDKCVFIDCEVGVPTTEVSWYYRGPAFANELSDAEFPINQTAELCCDVNFPELVVVWDKDGQEIQDGGKYKMGTDGYRRTLAIADADESDSGVYTATLKDGTKSSANVKVVAAPAMTYTPPPVYRGTVEGYELDNSWKKLSDTDRLSVKANGTNRKIEIRDVKASDAGEYCCATPDAKTFGRICVEAFKFVRALEDTEVGEKESAEFFVELSKPSRKVTWTLNGNKITSGGDSVLRNEGKILTCIMDNVSMDMAGTIAVEVEHIRCEAQLAVTKDIKFTSKLEDKFATEKEDVVYEISVSSVDAEVTWSADGEPIAQVDGKYTIQKDGRKRRLTVHNLTKNDAKSTLLTSTTSLLALL
ncbi:Oidioi.mRNA.OKI2018_I69.PAR.g10789.t1.cds [Oikopleura dioica]|uniref:Oidioi.mRNA.OKI2018_I69.PAR.g10789.t1.cds n=1 Tax=Oikopleura dioica TaxID=34765 RepID=A0ABN7RVP5_OIKDI|nr:Oidioi.mRNA.OKI2018_I69.PAR.g10789.t1.cds [Oikopleura dioica]